MKDIVKSMKNVCLGMVIFLLAMVPVVIVHHIVVVAKLPKSVDSLITRAYAIIEAMTDNTWFPTPSPALSVIKGYADDLKAAQVSVKARALGAKQDRDVKKNKLVNGLYALMAYIQGICDANPASAASIAESALYSAKKVNIKQKQVFGVRAIGNASVEITGALKGHRCSHEWGMTLKPDDAASWYATPIASTLQSIIIVGNLKVGDKMFFRHRCVTKDGAGDWEISTAITIL